MLDEEELGLSVVLGPRDSQFGSKTGKHAEAGLMELSGGRPFLRTSLLLVLLVLMLLVLR
jgi:hypothetical protein